MILVQDSIKEISDLLHKGKIILYPTDTIWGIGCDATNEGAIQRIFDIKNREASKPLIILANSIEMIKEYVCDLHPRVETLLTLHNRPLTIVHPASKNLPSNLTGGSPSIGIRLVQDAFCQELISTFGKPIVSTSANVSDEPFPRHFGEISSYVLKQIDYVVKYRQEEKTCAEPSVVATYDSVGDLIFLRS
jgi:L-threonylcarbamoyladenylate synthase